RQSGSISAHAPSASPLADRSGIRPAAQRPGSGPWCEGTILVQCDQEALIPTSSGLWFHCLTLIWHGRSASRSPRPEHAVPDEPRTSPSRSVQMNPPPNTKPRVHPLARLSGIVAAILGVLVLLSRSIDPAIPIGLRPPLMHIYLFSALGLLLSGLALALADIRRRLLPRLLAALAIAI